MRRILSIIPILAMLFSCDLSADQETETIRAAPKTEKDILLTENVPDNEALFSRFMKDLEKEKFAIETSEKKGDYSWYDGKRDLDVVVKGTGIRYYYIKRKEAEPEYYYPDFALYVFKFGDESKAKSCLNKIQAALKTGGDELRLKQPQIVARNKNEVFYFNTRAEMFRGYINDFAKRVENYQ